MSIATDLYIPGDTWLHRLDPRVKLWFSLLGMTVCVASRKIGVLVGVLLLAHAVLLLGGVSVRRLGQLWRGFALLIVIILILQPLLVPGDGPALWTVGPVRLTESGLMTGLQYAIRVAAVAFAALVPILTTPINTLVRGLHKVGLPYTWGLTIGLTLRYLGATVDLYNQIGEAQQARGWNLAQGGALKRARAAIPTLVAVIIAMLRLSDSLALALAARGFGARQQRSYLHDIAFRPVDWVVWGAATLVFGGLFALSIAL